MQNLFNVLEHRRCNGGNTHQQKQEPYQNPSPSIALALLKKSLPCEQQEIENFLPDVCVKSSRKRQNFQLEMDSLGIAPDRSLSSFVDMTPNDDASLDLQLPLSFREWLKYKGVGRDSMEDENEIPLFWFANGRHSAWLELWQSQEIEVLENQSLFLPMTCSHCLNTISFRGWWICKQCVGFYLCYSCFEQGQEYRGKVTCMGAGYCCMPAIYYCPNMHSLCEIHFEQDREIRQSNDLFRAYGCLVCLDIKKAQHNAAEHHMRWISWDWYNRVCANCTEVISTDQKCCAEEEEVGFSILCESCVDDHDDDDDEEKVVNSQQSWPRNSVSHTQIPALAGVFRNFGFPVEWVPFASSALWHITHVDIEEIQEEKSEFKKTVLTHVLNSFDASAYKVYKKMLVENAFVFIEQQEQQELFDFFNATSQNVRDLEEMFYDLYKTSTVDRALFVLHCNALDTRRFGSVAMAWMQVDLQTWGCAIIAETFQEFLKLLIEWKAHRSHPFFPQWFIGYKRPDLECFA